MRPGLPTTLPAITVVDDEPASRDVLVRAARLWRYHCQAAASADQAITLLEHHPTPIVLTDLMMPGHSGVWLVEQIQQRWPKTAVIVITGGHDADYASACLNAGAVRYCQKPIKLEELKGILDNTTSRLQRKWAREKQHRLLQLQVRRQTRRLRHTFLSAIESLARTLEARDPYTSGHSLRVCGYSLRLARKLDLSPALRKQLTLAAKLHDIGKVALPESILNKASSLTDAEMALVREHPIQGERILSPIIRNQTVLAAIRSHHERVDGTGYPDGLAGEDIPPLARIIMVVDSFDAMTSSRAYRPALPVSVALAALHQGAGTQFDPQFALPFAQMMEREGQE